MTTANSADPDQGISGAPGSMICFWVGGEFIDGSSFNRLCGQQNEADTNL